jgi:hypothetical protein
MDKLIHFFFFTCKSATLRIEQQQITALSFLNSFKLKMHLHFCKACTNYAKQSELIEKAIKENHNSTISNEVFKLSETAKFQINKALQEKMKEK